MVKKSIAQKLPHVVKLPVGAVSPTGSIYKHYDIVQQSNALSVAYNGPLTIRSSEPFTLRVSVKGKIREISSKGPKQVEIFTVVEQYPHREIASFWTLADATNFLIANPTRFAMPVVTSHNR